MRFFPKSTYDLFLTHGWHYTDEWQSLVALIDEHIPGRWRNWSLPWHDTSIERHTEAGKSTLTKILDGQIRMASAILLLPETRQVPNGNMWLQEQIRIGTHYSKPVIGILPFNNSRFPDDLLSQVNEIARRDARDILTITDRLCTTTAP